ncbi:Enhancer of mRNA-decapping protein 4 [Madurella mycetomatis]|uniref:Enhancer of mRNA-decapping protein 4 n=1 Tax=Madurella mycetomatis TaxID=100816 RepID=A0A175W316_9PEZI|nr:Enhancer of mRNA-decapping protein 4 [Madurella mycetomatis]
MHASLVVFAAVLGFADAANNLRSRLVSLNKRQAFDPTEETGFGETCVEAFGEGYIECGPMLCINPALGDTCCDNSWGCPADSFCLVQDLCCPTGLDPETCAAENNVSLPPDFGATTTSTPEDTATAEPTVSATPSTTGVPTGSVGNGTTHTTSSSIPIPTAGAYRERAGVAAAMLGLAAAIVL